MHSHVRTYVRTHATKVTYTSTIVHQMIKTCVLAAVVVGLNCYAKHACMHAYTQSSHALSSLHFISYNCAGTVCTYVCRTSCLFLFIRLLFYPFSICAANRVVKPSLSLATEGRRTLSAFMPKIWPVSLPPNDLACYSYGELAKL